MRATLRLPALIVTADGPRNGKDSSSRIRNPIGERRLLSNPVPRVCVGYEGPCIAPRKRQLLHSTTARALQMRLPPATTDRLTGKPPSPETHCRHPDYLRNYWAATPRYRRQSTPLPGIRFASFPSYWLHRRRVPLAPAAGTENFQSDNVDVPAPRCLAVIPSCWSKEMIWWRGKPRVPQ